MMTRGRTPAAFRRAVQDGHGWYGFGLDVEQTAHDIEAFREMEQRFQRPAELGRLEVSVTPPGYDIDSATAERYAAIGVDRLILRPANTRRGRCRAVHCYDCAGAKDHLRPC